MTHIAIDGPGGAGKSSVAKRIAARLKFIYVDTGALYRAVGYYMVARGIDPKDSARVVSALPNVKITLKFTDKQELYLCGEDVGDKIRTPEISMAASAVSAIPEVRAFLLDTQRSIAKKNNVIMAIEDHGALCKNSSEQLFYITTVNSPFLRATCDIGNYWTHGGELPEQGTAAIADMAVMVHVKDYVIINNKYTSVPSGDGIIDLKQCFRILRDADYQGTLSLEYECSIGEGIHGISTSLSNMRRLYVSC